MRKDERRSPPLFQLELGKRIRMKRKERGWSIKRLAEKAGANEVYVGQLERGEKGMTVHMLLKIADGLNIDPSELVAGIKRTSCSRRQN